LLLRVFGGSVAETKKNESVMATMIGNIINNLQITVKNIHVRYEDKLSTPDVRPTFLPFPHLLADHATTGIRWMEQSDDRGLVDTKRGEEGYVSVERGEGGEQGEDEPGRKRRKGNGFRRWHGTSAKGTG
jgi:hypothetical protein